MRLDRKLISRLVVAGFMLFLLIFWFMYTGQRLLSACTPIFIGLVIAYPLNIMIQFFRKCDILYRRKILKSEKIHRILTATLAVIVLLGCISFIIGYMGPQLTAAAITLLDKVPSGIQYLLGQPFVVQLIPDETMETLQKIDWSKWINHLVSLVNSDELFRGMTVTATSALSAASNILFGILFACYFLSGKETMGKVAKRMVRAFAPEGKQEGILHTGRLLNDCFHSFIVCQATQALVTGISATVLMNVFRFPYAGMIGTLNGFCALIPVVGGYLGAILGTLMILTDSPGMALLFLIFIVILQNVIGTLVFPRLMGQSMGVPSGWTLAAVLIGSGLGGITGILLGVPLTAFGYRMVKEKLEEKEKAGIPPAPETAETGEPPEAPKLPGPKGRERKSLKRPASGRRPGDQA